MSQEEEFIEFIVGALLRDGPDKTISDLVAGGMAEEDARAIVNNINNQIRSMEFREIAWKIQEELECGREVDEIVADIVKGGVPEEKARPVVELLAVQVLMKRGSSEAFAGSLINALLLGGDRPALESELEKMGVSLEKTRPFLDGIEALVASVERNDRGEGAALKAMRDFVRVKDSLAKNDGEGIIETLVQEGFDRKIMSDFVESADYFIGLEAVRLPADDTEEKEDD